MYNINRYWIPVNSFFTPKTLGTEVARMCKIFKFFWESNLLYSETTGWIPTSTVIIDIFSIAKSNIVAKQGKQFIATETWG